jgi:hypothetical protein
MTAGLVFASGLLLMPATAPKPTAVAAHRPVEEGRAAASAPEIAPLPHPAQFPALPVVRTWAELLALPAIDLGDGATVRLGVEAVQAPQWGGVLIYAYTEGYDHLTPRLVNRDRLGPLWVSVRFEGTSLDSTRTGPGGADKTWQLGDKQPRLFCKTVMIDRPGKYTFTIRTGEGAALAAGTITGFVAADFHPWTPLLLGRDTSHERVGEKYLWRRDGPAEVTVPFQGIALPNQIAFAGTSRTPWTMGARRIRRDGVDVTDERDPAYEKEIGTSFGNGPLPRLLPDAPDPNFALSIDAERTLRIEPCDVDSRPDRRFLSRWWVNGKPVIPTPGEPPESRINGMVARPVEDRDTLIRLDPKADWFRTGDLVEVQLLYCPAGWLSVKNPQKGALGGACGFPRMTNRASFRVP